MSASQGIKPKEQPDKTSVKEVMSPNPVHGVAGETAQVQMLEERFKRMEDMMVHMQQMFFAQQEEIANQFCAD